jgi:hypothetical protein
MIVSNIYTTVGYVLHERLPSRTSGSLRSAFATVGGFIHSRRTHGRRWRCRGASSGRMCGAARNCVRACDESQADAGYSAALRGDAAHHTVMTHAISGRPARSLANRFTALGRNVAPRDVPDYPIAYAAGKELHTAGKAKNEFGFGAQWAGQGAPLSRAMPAGELVALLRREIRDAYVGV